MAEEPEEPEETIESSQDPDYVPSESLIGDIEKQKLRTKLDALTNFFEMERIQYQICNDIKTLSPISIDYFQQIYRKLQNKLKEKFCSYVAPGQEEAMVQLLNDKQTTKNEIGYTLEHLKQAFDTCTTRKGRQGVLMLVPITVSKSKVCNLFGCSIYDIKTARAILEKFGACGEEPEKERMYSRLSLDKARHFIDFLFSTGLLQEVAYGTTKLKFDSGDKLSISNTILNGIREQAVKEYVIHCTEINYQPLGRSSLLNLLVKMKPHVRKKLAGIDTFVVDGIEAFETLRQSVKFLSNNEETTRLLDSIKRAENYLKARYKNHCVYNDNCVSHCINHGLSHPNDKQLQSLCDDDHSRYCLECVNLVSCITDIKLNISQLPTSHEKEVTQWEIANASYKIMEWQKHVLRGVQQSKARSNAFNSLGPTNALWIRDFAQKFLPSKTLEGLSDYFGKSGMSVSVEVFISKSSTTFWKQVYLVALDKCDQGSIETLCIADKVLEKFNSDYPNVKNIFVKTDNAASYHANGVPECTFKLAKEHGITIYSYDFNEAQLGKDQCDREAAFFKNCAGRWLRKSETNKITTAKELLHAVLSDGGPKNTKMCVMRIDKTLTKLKNVRKITNISNYHSVTYEENGLFYRESYKIGNGKFYDYSDVNLENGASLVVDWTSSTIQECPMTHDSRNQNVKFPCPETLCILDFKTEDELCSHIATAAHKYVKTKNTLDEALLYYAQQKHLKHSSDNNISSNYTNVESTIDNDEDESIQNFKKIFIQGWARKIRRVRKMTEKQKSFVKNLFLQGAATKVKLSAEQMGERMREHMIDGDYFFHADEYLEPSQIRSLISRFTREQKAQPIQPASETVSEYDGIEANMDEIDIESDEEDFYGFDTFDEVPQNDEEVYSDEDFFGFE